MNSEPSPPSSPILVSLKQAEEQVVVLSVCGCLSCD